MMTIGSAMAADYEASKKRLMALLAANETGRDAKIRSGLLPARESEELSLGVFALRASIESYVACSDILLQHLDDAQRNTLIEMLGYCSCILSASAMVSRNVGLPTIGDHSAVNKIKSKSARAGKTAAMKVRAEKVRGIIESAPRRPGKNWLFKNPSDVLADARQKLKQPQLDRKTLNSYRRHIDETVKGAAILSA